MSRVVAELAVATGIAPAVWRAELEQDPAMVATVVEVLNRRR
jgi:hypothetical protein